MSQPSDKPPVRWAFATRYLPVAVVLTAGVVASFVLFNAVQWLLRNRVAFVRMMESDPITYGPYYGAAYLVAGLLFTFLVSLYLFLVLGRATHIERTVARRTAELSQVNGELAREVSKRRRLEQIKDEFISNVSHEIRTPLTLIKLSISNLQAGVEGELNRRQLNLAEQTQRHINRLGRIINDLLDLSRLESGKATLNLSQLNASGLVRDIVEEATMTAKDRELAFEADVSRDLPSVYADGDMLTQVLHNLLNNAYRFARSKVFIRVHPEAPEGDAGREPDGTPYVRFTVGNDGPGIDPKDMDSLFRKFEQINRPSGGGGYKGTGLGLAICKEMISLHHGQIWAESLPEGPTLFHFTVPQYDPNREFKLALEEALLRAARERHGLAIVSLSVDAISEIRGHGGERALLRLFDHMEAIIRREALRATDRLSRHVSRDHIVILFDKAGREGLNGIQNRLVKVINKSSAEVFGDLPFPHLVTGVASYPEDGEDADSLIRRALKDIRRF